jgi:hypothetical protein
LESVWRVLDTSGNYAIGDCCRKIATTTLADRLRHLSVQDSGLIRAFAGADSSKAQYYDFEKDFLLELEPCSTHYEVCDR